VALALRELKRWGTPAPAVPAAFSPPSLAAEAGSQSASLGLNLLGHFESPSGVGQVARGFVSAALGASLPNTAISLDTDPRADLARGLHHPRAGGSHPLTLVCANADELGQALARIPAAVHASGWTVGYWFWELAHFPLEFAPAFELVDEVWAPSRFCFEAFRALATVPVRLVPPFVPTPGTTERTRAELGWNPESVVVLSLLDVRSVPERKHPEGLIAALAEASRLAPALHLELVVSHADEAPEFVARLRAAAQGLPVSIVARTLPREEVDARLRHCDAYASLHRAEGLGLPLIEALAIGKPVIATAHGGVLDFLDETTGFPVPCRLVALDHELPPYPRGACWAEPDVSAAAAMLRALVAEPDEARRRAERGRARVAELYGLAAAQGRLRAECERLLREGPRW